VVILQHAQDRAHIGAAEPPERRPPLAIVSPNGPRAPKVHFGHCVELGDILADNELLDALSTGTAVPDGRDPLVVLLAAWRSDVLREAFVPVLEEDVDEACAAVARIKRLPRWLRACLWNARHPRDVARFVRLRVRSVIGPAGLRGCLRALWWRLRHPGLARQLWVSP
jgi:hypothetical protein